MDMDMNFSWPRWLSSTSTRMLHFLCSGDTWKPILGTPKRWCWNYAMMQFVYTWLIVNVWLCWRHFSKSQPIPACCKSLTRTDFGSSFGKQIHTRRDRDPKQWQQDLPFLPVESSDAISAAKTLATATRDLPWDQRSPGWCNWGVPPMIVISEIKVSILYESMLDVHEIVHAFFSAKYCNDRASQTNIPLLDPEMLELLEQAIKLGTPSLLPHLQRYAMLSKASLCFMFKYLQTVRNSTDRKGRHRNAGSLVIYKNYRDKTKQSDSSNKNGGILR